RRSRPSRGWGRWPFAPPGRPLERLPPRPPPPPSWARRPRPPPLGRWQRSHPVARFGHPCPVRPCRSCCRNARLGGARAAIGSNCQRRRKSSWRFTLPRGSVAPEPPALGERLREEVHEKRAVLAAEGRRVLPCRRR